MLVIGPIGLLYRRHRVVACQVKEKIDDAEIGLDWPFALKWDSSSRRFWEMRTH